MKSRRPKGLHEVCGLPMVEWAVRAFEGAGVLQPVLVVGHGGEAVAERFGSRVRLAWQHKQLGTGHAALMAREVLLGHQGPVLIAPGDAPGITAESLRLLATLHVETEAAVTLATVRLPDPTGYGRVVRDGAGRVLALVEEKDADSATKTISEVGVSVYCVDAAWAFSALPRLSNSNAQGEYYLTDLVALANAEGRVVRAHTFADAEEFAGVNDRWQLAEVEERMRRSILRRHALAGVTIRDLATTFVGPDVRLGEDVVLESGTRLLGTSSVGDESTIGPWTQVSDSEIGPGCQVALSVLSGVCVGAGVRVGPFAHLRPGTVVGEGSRVGNFVEVKNALLGPGVSAAHLAYLGDAEIGARTNVGAGTITANYDGFRKHRTTVGADVFLGSNSTLIAPVEIGSRALVTAGSVITLNVPEEAGAFGRARTEIKEGWATKWRFRAAAAVPPTEDEHAK